jgi:hypothetical protein
LFRRSKHRSKSTKERRATEVGDAGDAKSTSPPVIHRLPNHNPPVETEKSAADAYRGRCHYRNRRAIQGTPRKTRRFDRDLQKASIFGLLNPGNMPKLLLGN